MIHCVDPWEGEIFKGFPDGPAALDKFLICAKSLGLADRLSLIRNTSMQAVEMWDGALGLVHIDGSHVPSFVDDDILQWGRKIGPGGVLVGHDWNSPGVMDAVLRAEKAGLLVGVQELAKHLGAVECNTSPAPDHLCIWTARVGCANC
jgi:hypothetical protein